MLTPPLFRPCLPRVRQPFDRSSKCADVVKGHLDAIIVAVVTVIAFPSLNAKNTAQNQPTKQCVELAKKVR